MRIWKSPQPAKATSCSCRSLAYGRYAVFPHTDHDFFATFKPIQISFTTDSTGKATQVVRHQKPANMPASGGTDRTAEWRNQNQAGHRTI